MLTRSVMKACAVAVLGVAMAAAAGVAPAQDKATLKVTPCDGGDAKEMTGYTAGERLSPERAQGLADTLMASWLSRQPAEVAEGWARERAEAVEPAAQTAPAGTQPMQTTDFSARDFAMWQSELAHEVALGDKIFHSDKEIGSPEGIACAMCHPNASNTHPETYPKFQVQLKRVALLRDMINWCIENPVRGKRLADDDPKLRALEAYILWQRKGKELEPGKH
jgi:thiosulfate dehydrogenase